MKATLEQFDSREKWLDARQTGIGGSDAAAVLGISKYKTPLSVYADKLGLSERPDTKLLARGRKLEPIIIEDYQEETGRGVGTYGIHLFRSPALPFQTVSLDGLIEKADEKDGAGVLEAKSAAFMSPSQLAEDPPIDWLCQAQHAMAVMNLKWASITVFCVVSGELLWLDVDRNDRFVEHLTEQEAAFWERLQKQEPPLATATDAEALRLLYPRDDGTTVSLPKEADDWLYGWEAASAAEKQAKAEKEKWTNLLKEAMGPATYGVLPDGTRLSLKTQQRKEHVVKASTYRTLRKEKS